MSKMLTEEDLIRLAKESNSQEEFKKKLDEAGACDDLFDIYRVLDEQYRQYLQELAEWGRKVSTFLKQNQVFAMIRDIGMVVAGVRSQERDMVMMLGCKEGAARAMEELKDAYTKNV